MWHHTNRKKSGGISFRATHVLKIIIFCAQKDRLKSSITTQTYVINWMHVWWCQHNLWVCVPVMGAKRKETVVYSKVWFMPSSIVTWSVVTCRERASSQDSLDPLKCLLLPRPVRDPTRDFRVAPNPFVPPPGVWTLLWLRPNPCGCASKHFWYRSYKKTTEQSYKTAEIYVVYYCTVPNELEISVSEVPVMS
jgi:hypothetical protein